MKSIGRHGSPWTPDTARTEAKRLLGVVAGGTDPFAQSLSGESFGAEVERYLERKRAGLKPSAYRELCRYLHKYAVPLHRLRLAELGVQPHIIEAVLNHVSGHKAGVAGIYNRARYEGEMRSALQRWADHVEAITRN
jgi:hypothetical protein